MEELVSMQKVIDLWDKYHPTIAVNAIEYDAELRKLPTLNQDSIETQSNDLISRQAVLGIAFKYCPDDDGTCSEAGTDLRDMLDELENLPPAQLEIVRCKDCKYWNSGSCEYPEHAVNCQDYWVGDIETEAEHFCGYADRREATE